MTQQLVFKCLRCQTTTVQELGPDSGELRELSPDAARDPSPTADSNTGARAAPASFSPLRCHECDWTRPVAREDLDAQGQPVRCLVCGCDDLWRQKDFPQSVGLAMVAAGAILSSIAWYWHRPALAIGILLGFAAIDLLLFTVMRDMLVCYRCATRHRGTPLNPAHSGFNLEVAERYRQQQLRLRKAGTHTVPSRPAETSGER